jgi:hypothetical protein
MNAMAMPVRSATFARVEKKVGDRGALEDCPVLERTYRKAITAKTVRWLLGDLRAIGVEVDSFTQLDPQQPGAINLIGREIIVHCEHGVYEDEPCEEWGLRPPRRPRLASDEVRRLDDAFGHLLNRKPGANRRGEPGTSL